ncbi:MAG: 4-alpha-glucanotransferase [Puniceicoccales bacterium]|nr:4-alpha-glucanotransferase [Puniceicoccales bacterium]
MPDVRATFVKSFDEKKKSLGVRLDALENMQLFRSRQSIEMLMAFLGECGVKLLNIGSIFALQAEKPISSFALCENFLTSAIFDRDIPAAEITDSAVKFFSAQKTREIREEFTTFCSTNKHWLDGYCIFCALAQQIGTNNFPQWPDILRICSHKTAEIVKKQLADEIMRRRIVQFFASKQLDLIKNLANRAGIFLCGDCNILCESLGADVWENQKIFFVNALSTATIFAGLPPRGPHSEGIKTTKVPYRIGALKDTHYDFFEHLFSRWQGMFDAIFLLNGHAIFQYWEVACDENSPKQGRWVNLPTDMFFEYLDSHFNNFPYFFDFNEPLLPINEVILKRHRLLPTVIDGEANFHAAPSYDLQRELFAVASCSCDSKISGIKTSDTNFSHTQSCLNNFANGNYKLCVLHFDEICNIAGCKPANAVADPKTYGKAFARATRAYF